MAEESALGGAINGSAFALRGYCGQAWRPMLRESVVRMKFFQNNWEKKVLAGTMMGAWCVKQSAST